MAKVKGPLFGFRAQGKIKKEYIFQDHPHWKICKKYQVAPNPRTPSQIEIRNTMQGLIKEWQKLTDTEKEAWNDYCNKFYKKTQSGYSLFLKLNFDYYRETGKVNKYPPGYAPPGPIQEGLVAWFKFDKKILMLYEDLVKLFERYHLLLDNLQDLINNIESSIRVINLIMAEIKAEKIKELLEKNKK